MFLKKITELIIPPIDPINIGNEVLRRKTNEKLGIEIPEDYYSFISTYGLGLFGNGLCVFNPFTENEFVNLFKKIEELSFSYNYMKQMDQNTRKQFRLNEPEEGEGFPFDFYPKKNGILPWGHIDGGGLTFYWKTNNDRWYVIAYSDDGYYEKFEMSMTEFIFKLLTNQIEFDDLSDNFSGDMLVFNKI